MKKFIIKFMIICVFALNVICYHDVAVFSETLELPVLPDVSQSHYVIYREGNRDNRIELAVFDCSEGEYQSIMLELPLIYTWGGDLETENIPVEPRPQTAMYLLHTDDFNNCQKYYLDNNQWIAFDEQVVDKISENATELINSNLPYVEVIRKGESDNDISYWEPIIRGSTFFTYINPTLYGKSPDGIHNYEEIQPGKYELTDSNIVEGDNICLATGPEEWGTGLINARLKYGNHTNSPLYIYDNDYNLIKSIEIEGCYDLTTVDLNYDSIQDKYNYIGGFYYDGVFYITNRKYSEGIEYNFYKTTDGENLTEIAFEEMEEKYREYKSYRDTHQNTFTGYNIYVKQKDFNDATSSPEMFLSTKNMPDVKYNVLYEKETFTNLSVVAQDNDKVYGYMPKLDENNNVKNSKITIDGVYGVSIPRIMNLAWTTEEYIYLTDTYYKYNCDYYYRVPVEELQNNIIVRLNDTILGFSQPPVMEDDRTLVPMRFLFEQMGAEVEWDDNTQTATATVPVSAEQQIATFSLETENSVTFSIDNLTATVNGELETMDVPARLINDQTFVPLRFLSENLGYNVEWDENTNTAIITTE